MSENLALKKQKEDRRVKRTKKNLRDSLFTLLEEKNINQITVTELTTVRHFTFITTIFSI